MPAPYCALRQHNATHTLPPMSGNGPVCSICADPKRQGIDAELLAGRSIRQTAAMFGCSLAALYRHHRSSHHDSAALALQATNGQQNSPTLAPAISATLRAVQALARESQRHLREARKGSDLKATNGAITAAAKALELVGKLRGELQQGGNVNVQVSVEAKAAMDARSVAQSMRPEEVTAQAEQWIAALLAAEDAHAVAAVGRLMRMLPSAESTEGI